MGFFKKIKKFAGFAAPLAGLIPGVGILGAAALGGGIGALGGGGIKGALGGAIGAAGVGGAGSVIGGALGAGTGAAGTALGSGILGATGGALTGGGKGALVGGALGGAGGYIQGSGGIGNAFKNITGQSGGGLAVGGAGSSYGGFDSPAELANADSVAAGLTPTAAAPAASSSFATPLISAGIGTFTNQRAEDQLLDAQGKAADLYSPFLNAEFDPSQLDQDAGYQFQLAEGNKALDRAAAARGGFFSGQAYKEAADYSKGLTDTTLQDAYQRYANDQRTKLGVAGGLADIYGNQGNIRANATTNLGNIFTGSLSAATGGRSVNSSGQIVDPSSQIDPRLLAYYRQYGSV